MKGVSHIEMKKYLILFTAFIFTTANAYNEDAYNYAHEFDRLMQDEGDRFDLNSIRPELNQNTLSEDLLNLANEIVEISAEASERGRSEVLNMFDINEDFLSSDRPDRSPSDSVDPSKEWIDILVSRSMGETEIRELMKDLSVVDFPVRLVFRGIDDGQRINDAMGDYARWAQDIENPPEGMIDPTIFQNHGTDTVPRMIYMKDEKVVASVDGIQNPLWLRDAVKNGQTGYLGVRGPIVEVTEQDLIEVMQARLQEIDFEEKKQQTIDTFWQRATLYHLPYAVETRVRNIDPSILINEDMRDSLGNLIHPAGTIINPLHLMPFNMRLIIINPNNPQEVEWAMNLEKNNPHLRDMVILSEVDRDNGWSQFEDLHHQLKTGVYQLKEDVKSRFHIEKTPTIVTADRQVFIVTEIGRGDL